MSKITKSISKLEFKNGLYNGGFSSLTQDQLLKLKGGANANCTNDKDCTKGTHQVCTNSGACYISPGSDSTHF